MISSLKVSSDVKYQLTVINLFHYLQVFLPNCVVLLRGNHESKYCTSVYGFEQEVMVKYKGQGAQVYRKFLRCFEDRSTCTWRRVEARYCVAARSQNASNSPMGGVASRRATPQTDTDKRMRRREKGRRCCTVGSGIWDHDRTGV